MFIGVKLETVYYLEHQAADVMQRLPFCIYTFFITTATSLMLDDNIMFMMSIGGL